MQEEAALQIDAEVKAFEQQERAAAERLLAQRLQEDEKQLARLDAISAEHHDAWVETLVARVWEADLP